MDNYKSYAMNMLSAPIDGLSIKANVLQEEKLQMIDRGSSDLNSISATSITGDFDLSKNTADANLTCWGYWEKYYYPYVYPSYPVYVQERAIDKGKKAFELIKLMQDKKFVKMNTVKDFIDLMDLLINSL